LPARQEGVHAQRGKGQCEEGDRKIFVAELNSENQQKKRGTKSA